VKRETAVLCGAAAVVAFVAVTVKRRPVPKLHPEGDLYPSGKPGVFLWARKVSPLVRRIFDGAYLSPEPVANSATSVEYETPQGERYYTVATRDHIVMSASRTIAHFLDDGGDVSIWTTPDLGRVRITLTALAKPGWVLLAHAQDRGAF
jgi:hypothetical protein